jgi:arginase family enzyme
MVHKLAPHVDCLDVVEVNPLFDLNDQTASVAAKLLMDVIIGGVVPA